MTAPNAFDFLNSLANYERQRDPQAVRAVRLARMERLCRLLGDPQRTFRAVLVAGTNGKGAISTMLYSMLRESAVRAGLYLSPHVESLQERIRVWTMGPSDAPRTHGDDWIGEDALADVLAEIRPVVETVSRSSPDGPLTYFEVLTAAAFVYFARRRVEIAVLEVGLGGRLDATNVVTQAVTIFGPIDMDHADILGRDPAAIAREKAGVIKPGQQVVSAAQAPEVLAVLQQACDRWGVPMTLSGRDVTWRVTAHDLEGMELMIAGARGIYEAITLPLLGRHQAENAALAVTALELLADTGEPTGVVEQGLRQVEWPARQEMVQDRPLVLLDGGHNPSAAEALCATLEELAGGRRTHFIIGMSADKSAEEIGRRLGPRAASIVCTASRHPRAIAPAVLADRLAPFCRDVQVVRDALDAYTYVVNAVGSEDLVVVTGSLFLAGDLRAALRRSRTTRPRQRQPA